MATTLPSLHSLLITTFLLSLASLFTPSLSSTDSFVYGGCSQIKYPPNSPYESNLDSLLPCQLSHLQLLRQVHRNGLKPTRRNLRPLPMPSRPLDARLCHLYRSLGFFVSENFNRCRAKSGQISHKISHKPLKISIDAVRTAGSMKLQTEIEKAIHNIGQSVVTTLDLKMKNTLHDKTSNIHKPEQ
ncbi:hypothetical protein RHMOL_Rhmol10G0261700 [Rhododendron molle]|uniref:Uncharacterized protein n=1 Tax=Rhododendron molle TaxID=49168 RepID=A0ACC0M7D4_RHOML|nr:hypothetical protein RHMOL_Rhmol10G0261700 [Rhododendron molle]